jgi:hypothetical protein
MWPFPNPLDLFGQAVSSAAGWAWDKVVQGIYSWFANGLLVLLEWVWRVLDTATTPRLTDGWFANGLVAPLAAIAFAVTVAMMLVSAVQAGFGGRPELVVDALKEGPKAIVATALTLVVMDVLVQGADVLADAVWQAGRGDAETVIDGLAKTVSAGGPFASTFLAPLVLLLGMIGLLVTAVVLFMRSALLYLVAGFAPIVWATSVSPVFRGGGRKLVHVTVALVLAKPAIALTLVVGVKLVANTAVPGTAGASSAVAALGSLVAGFACFAVAALSPWVVYRLLPSLEHAQVGSGVVGGWGRSAMGAVHAALLVKSFGASAGLSAATRSVSATASAATTAASASVAPASGSSTRSMSRVASSPVRPGPSAGRSAFPASAGSGQRDRSEEGEHE